MPNLIPPLQTRGRFELTSPYSVSGTMIYTVVALRKFVDLLVQGEDIVETYYTPVGLGEDQYQSDSETGAVIVTLKGEDNTFYYVPSTYIASYPRMGGVDYQYIAISTAFALPTYVGLDDVKHEIMAKVSEVTGLSEDDVNVYTDTLPFTGKVSAENHEAFEAARQNAIETRVIDAVRVQELTATVASQQAMIQQLVQIMHDNGYVFDNEGTEP